MIGDLLNQTQVAVMLGCSRDRIRRWTRAGILPHFPDPETGHPVYSRIAVTEWQATQGRLAAERGAA